MAQLRPIDFPTILPIDMGAMVCLDRRCSIGKRFHQTCRSTFGWTSTQLLSVGLSTNESIDVGVMVCPDRYADYGTSESYLVPTAKELLRQSWLASKPSHQFWWYWCIGPTDPRSMNTFIERPAIEARLLYWLTALHAVNGMLYYDVSHSLSRSHCVRVYSLTHSYDST